MNIIAAGHTGILLGGPNWIECTANRRAGANGGVIIADFDTRYAEMGRPYYYIYRYQGPAPKNPEKEKDEQPVGINSKDLPATYELQSNMWIYGSKNFSDKTKTGSTYKKGSRVHVKSYTTSGTGKPRAKLAYGYINGRASVLKKVTSNPNVKKKASKPKTNPNGFNKEKAVFTNGNTEIQVRKGSPGLSAPKAGKLKPGASITYEGWIAKDGYTWVRYTGNSGSKLYLPVRKGNTPYGTFSEVGKANKPRQIATDGSWGPDCTKRLQEYFGTKPVDGVISGQIKNSANQNIPSAKWGTSGSNVVKAMQKQLGISQDGNIGPGFARALQKHYGTTQDGVISRPSNVVKKMQQALNKGKF